MKQMLKSLQEKLTGLTKKQKIFLATALIVICIGLFLLLHPQNKKPSYATVKVQKGEIISNLSESGTINISNQTNVNSPTDGVIEEVYVKNGDVVQDGENLFKVKSTATAQEKASAYAAYLSAVNSEKSAEVSKLSADAQMWGDQQSVLNAQNTVDYKNANSVNPSTKQNYTDLEKQSIDSALTIARKQFLASEQKYKDADAAINASKAQLTSAWLSYQNTLDSVVTAPTSGTIANFSTVEGGNVLAGNTTSTSSSSSTSSNSSSNNSSSPVLIIGDFSKIIIKTQINEIDITKVKPNQKVTVTLDAFPDKTFVGEITSIDSIGTANSGVVSYTAYITLISPPPDIMSGMTASANIQLNRKENVLTVPTEAIQTSSEGSYVRVLKNNLVTQIPVELGISSDTDTEITSGLNEGDVVITSINTGNSSTAGTTASPFGQSTFGRGGGGLGGSAVFRRVGGRGG
jgi:RND family efflux transporter MFP subunit